MVHQGYGWSLLDGCLELLLEKSIAVTGNRGVGCLHEVPLRQALMRSQLQDSKVTDVLEGGSILLYNGHTVDCITGTLIFVVNMSTFSNNHRRYSRKLSCNNSRSSIKFLCQSQLY